MGVLGEIYSDVFATVFIFRALSAEDRPDVAEFRKDVVGLLDRARRKAEQSKVDPQEHVFYAAVGLVDETAMTADWRGSDQWRREPLQVQYFGKFLAGEQFFQRLDDLQSGADADLLDAYFTCMVAGFKGMYRDDANALSSRRRKLFQQINKIDLRDEKHLTEDAYGRNLQRNILRSHFPIWWLLPFLLGALALYAAYYAVLLQQVGQIVEAAS
jgi:type VI secretion system protein ImpK